MAELVKPNAEYDRRATIVEGFRVKRTPSEIIQYSSDIQDRIRCCEKIHGLGVVRGNPLSRDEGNTD